VGLKRVLGHFPLPSITDIGPGASSEVSKEYTKDITLEIYAELLLSLGSFNGRVRSES